MAEDYVLQTKVTADSTQFDATLKKAGKSLTAFSSEITNVTKLLGTLFVGQKIVKFAKTSIDSIEKERKELNLLNTTLKTTGATAWTTQEQLADMAKAFESESNYTSEQIQRAQTVMLGFKTVTGDVFNSAMQNVLDMSEVMGMDLVSAVQTVGKALDDPVKGLGSLQRQGFAFSESQKAMLEEMVKTGRQAEAQKIILDELATTYGGAAKAGQNAFQQLDIAIGNLQKVIGENLAPVVESIATDITELINQFNSLDKGTQAFILTAGSLLTTLPLIVKGINTLKVALVSLQTSVPALLAITAGIAGISAIVGAVVKKKNEFSELSKEITKISSTTKNYLDTYSEGNEEKKLDEKATKELIKLYPELSGKVSAYTTSVEDARNAVNDLVNQKLIDAESSGIKDYIQKLNEIEKLNEKVNKLTSHKNELDEKMAKEIQNVSIPAIQKLADEERNSINERLKAIGKLLTLEGSIVEIPIELTPAENLEATKKSWQEALKEVLKIGDDFSTGKEAVNIYLSNMEEALKQDKRISEALGEKFDISSALKAQQEQISQVIADLLQQTDIDKPFDIEELSKESTALGSLAQAYKQMGEVISSTNQTISEESNEWTDKLLAQEIAILEKRRDNEIEWAKNAKKSEDEIYAIRADYVEKINELQVKQLNSQRDAEIKKVKNSKQSAESQKKIISQINEYYDKQIDLMNEATERFTKKSGGFLEEWSKQYQSLAGNWTQTFVDMANIGTDTMGDMFTMLGENLAGAGHGYEDFAATATEALSEVLKGLAAQLSALAVTKAVTFQWGQAAIAAAGAATALVAAGALKNTSKSIKDVGDAAEKSAGSLEEFMKKMEQIKEGTYGQEAGLLQLGQSQLARQIEEAKKKRDEWEKIYADYMAMRNYYVQEYYKGLPDPSDLAMAEKYQKLADSAWAESRKLNDAVRELNSQYASAPTETLNRLKDEVAGVQDVIYSYQSLYNSVEAYYSLSEKVNSYSKKDQETARRYNELLQKHSVQAARWILKQEGYNLTINAQFLAQLLNNLKKYQNSIDILKESIVKDIETLRQDVTTSLISIGKDIGEQFVSSIIDGTKSTDFMGNMKKTIRSYMIKMAIYTESFSKKMGEIGSKLIEAISAGGDKRQLTTAKEELLALYETAEKTAEKLDKTLDNVFGKTSESIDTATDSLTKFEETMKSVLESIQDLGGDIASNLVDALSNGLTQSDFLGNMKTWLRNMMIQMVVYTDTMKAEVEEIGKRISEGLTSGFTDTSLHEIRRDLSYIFEQTSSKMANLDTILDGVFSGYATGTENARRGIHLVGEAGPELVQFKGGERVFNNRDTMSMMAGGNPSNNFNVTFNNLQDTSAFAMMSQLKQYQREMAFNAVI